MRETVWLHFRARVRRTLRGNDTDAALGSDIVTVALKAYGLLKLTGRGEGTEPLRRELSGMYWKKRSAKAVDEETAAQPERRAA
jgi:hypothetical protein